MTAASTKSIAAKAAAVSAAEDLQDDTDETAAVTQSQMPVDVAAQLHEAQQLAQQQAADFKSSNEGSSARLDAATTTTGGAGTGLATGIASSTEADPTALSATDSTLDAAEKLQRAQQHQSQQAATFKQNSEGTTARLDVAGDTNPAVKAAATGTAADQLSSLSSLSDAGVAQEVGNADAASSTYGTGLEGLGQTADLSALPTSLGSAAALSNADLAQGAGVTDTSASGSDTGITGLTDYDQYAQSEDSTGAVASNTAAAESDTAAADYVNEIVSTGSTATSSDYVQDLESSGTLANTAVSSDQVTRQAGAVGQDPFSEAQSLPDIVTVTR